MRSVMNTNRNAARIFGDRRGFTLAEVATMQGVSERTVQCKWEKARLLLFRALEGRS